MKVLKVLRIVLFVVAVVLVVGFVTMHLWNWVVPPVFGLRTITFGQALALLLLGKILFGGFHRHGGGRRGWKRHMGQHWERMSPEERERFRAGMRDRWGCRPAPMAETAK